jgi:phage FluMu protein Com
MIIDTLKIQCPKCKKITRANVNNAMDYIGTMEDSVIIQTTIIIKCDQCNEEVYRKEEETLV